MKLTDALKNKPETVHTKEAADAILSNAHADAEHAGIAVDDAELDQVAGGNHDNLLE